jgi:hypothetical protein
MAKRPTVDVDEEYLREVMAGGAGRIRKEEDKQPLPVSPTADSVKEENAESTESEKTTKPGRKKREVQPYEAVFLQRRASVPRQQTYIASELYEKINNFLPVLTRKVSFPAYLDNILIHHLELYRDDINEMYESKLQKPL